MDAFREIWLVDFEFRSPPGERPTPLCMVAREHHTGRTLRLWADELFALPQPPFSVGQDALFVAYYASAELGCFLALDWPMPVRILDLFAEFRCLTNGLPVPAGNGLLGALTHFGLDAIDSAEKDSMRDLAMRGGRYSADERAALLDYCESDVLALDKLLPVMLPAIDLPRALLRGRYMGAAARMEWAGVPIDAVTLEALRSNWGHIKGRLIVEVDAEYQVYVPTGRTEVHAEIKAAADSWEVDPYELADAVDYCWRAEKDATADFYAAKREARKLTGLTAPTLNRLEDSSLDHTTVGRFDETARELASRFPVLGLGGGYETGNGFDSTDYAGRLWAMLRDDRDRPRRRTDPEIIREAVDLALSGFGSAEYRSLSFSGARFADWLGRSGIPWPRLESGWLDLSDDAFRQMARQYPIVAPLRELRHSLSQFRLNDLAVGSDGRNRCLLSAFRARTGRNQPSNSRFIYGPSVWLRGLIAPEPGRAVAYVDWSQQEFGIAAALSGDRAMLDAYQSGDPYLTFAMQAGAAPADATKETHGAVRDRFKVCALAVQYGMAARSLAHSIGEPEIVGRELLRLHRQTYPNFWEWSQAAVDHAMLRGWLQTVFGWRIHVGRDANPRSLANFPTGQRCGNAAARLLSGDRSRNRGLCAGPRCATGRRSDGGNWGRSAGHSRCDA